MNIVFLTEQNYIGKVPDNYPNLRTEYAWMNMLDAFHLPYNEVKKDSQYSSIIDTADFIIMIPSKKNPEVLGVAHILHQMNKPFGIMQEGPNHLWQDWPVDKQIIYLGIIKQLATIVFVHNECDRKYFEGLTTRPVVILQTVSKVEEALVSKKLDSRKIMVGGTMCSWYGGMNSYLSVRNAPEINRIMIPSMGRKQAGEEEILKQLDERINYLPYQVWTDFLYELSECYFAIHLMPTAAAGSFSLNCAMVGIPCIGNIHDDTQRILFPELSIDVTDVKKAADLANRLKTDSVFYSKVVTESLNNINRFSITKQKQKYINLIESVINA